MNRTSPRAFASLPTLRNFIPSFLGQNLRLTLGAASLAGLASFSTATAAQSSQDAAASVPAYTETLKTPAEIAQRKRDPLNPRVDRFQPGRFPVGFYLYKYEGAEENLKRMAELGFTSIHLIQSSQDVMEATFDQCRELGMSILLQLDGVYLQMDSDIPALIPRAVALIERYKDRPEILAFSIKEEPSEAFMPKVSEYYQGIYASIPDAPIYMLHNYIRVMEGAPPPYPAMVGTDRYGFWWEFGTAGNRATPASAMRWYHTQMNAYYQNSLKQNGEFFAVLSPVASHIRLPKDKISGYFYPKDIPEGKRADLTDMVQRFVDEKNQGWWEDETDKAEGTYSHWKYYYAPENTIRATSWLSVMEGAKSVYCYHWIVGWEERYKERGRGERGMSDKQVEEYAVFAREIQRYGSLVRGMMKEFAPYAGRPLGHEEVHTDPLPEIIVDFPQNEVAFRTFRVDGYEGRVVVAVNQHVGEWGDGSPYSLKPDHRFRINEKGELIDYTPATGSRELNFTVGKQKMACLDLKTGEPVKLDTGGRGAVAAEPGEGRMLFFYPEGTQEGEQLLKEFALR